jgi:hypothetical protein
VIGAPRHFTSHWRNPELRDLDATIIGISRGVPRGNPGYRYRVLRSLAPSRETFAIQDRERYAASFRAQLEELGAGRILADLKRIGGTGSIVMLCWEPLADPSEWCHRRMLARYIERETGLEIPELKAQMLPQREDVAHRSLF